MENTYDGAIITVRNYSGDVNINNTGALTLGDTAGINWPPSLRTATSSQALSRLTVATDIYTIGTGDIELNATADDNLTVNSGITINAEAGSVSPHGRRCR